MRPQGFFQNTVDGGGQFFLFNLPMMSVLFR